MDGLERIVKQISSRNQTARDLHEKRSQELIRIVQHGDNEQLNEFIDGLATDSVPPRESSKPTDESGETSDDPRDGQGS